MHIGRLIKEVVDECDSPWKLSSDSLKLGAVLSELGAYVTLRAEAFDTYESGNHIKATAMQHQCVEMLERLRRCLA